MQHAKQIDSPLQQKMLSCCYCAVSVHVNQASC